MQKLIFTNDYPEFTDGYTFGNFEVSNKSIFFWNHFKAWVILFESDTIEKVESRDLSLTVQSEVKLQYIKSIVVGSQIKNDETISIIIKQSEKTDMVVIWDT